MVCCAASDGSLWTPVIRPISVPVVTQRTPIPTSSDIRDPRSDPGQPLPLESRRAASTYSLPPGRSGVNGPTLVNGFQSAQPGRARPRSVENMDLRIARLPPDQQQSPMHIPSRSGGIQPRSTENVNLQVARFPPDQSPMHIPSHTGRPRSEENMDPRIARLAPNPSAMHIPSYGGQERPRSSENIDLRMARSPLDQSPMHIPSSSYAEDRDARSPPYRIDTQHQSLPRNLSHGGPASARSGDRSGPADGPYELQDQSLDRDRSRSLSSDRRKYFPPLQQDRSSQRDERGRQLENTRREVRSATT